MMVQLVNRLRGLVVKRPLTEREVVGSIPGRVIPKDVKTAGTSSSLAWRSVFKGKCLEKWCTQYWFNPGKLYPVYRCFTPSTLKNQEVSSQRARVSHPDLLYLTLFLQVFQCLDLTANCCHFYLMSLTAFKHNLSRDGVTAGSSHNAANGRGQTLINSNKQT